MGNDGNRDPGRETRNVPAERLYALLYQLSDRIRDVDLQVRALGRRLDEMKKEENGGRT